MHECLFIAFVFYLNYIFVELNPDTVILENCYYGARKKYSEFPGVGFTKQQNKKILTSQRPIFADLQKDSALTLVIFLCFVVF